MIILGDHYKFLDYELKILKEKYGLDVQFAEQNQNPEITISEIEKLVNNNITTLILNLPNSPSKELISYLTKLELKNIRFLTLERIMEDYFHKCYIPEDSPDLSFLQNIHHLNSLDKLQKKVIDILGAVTLLILSFPVMVFTAYKIKKESPGPIFYTQKRVGKDGKSFIVIKFRSMRLNCEFNPYTSEDDKRIFSYGKIMRKTRIDELPQIFNVLKGEMSLIGPRAEWDILVKKYEEEVPYYHERHLVKPGITGWAQVNFPYGKGTDDSYQKLMYDLYYIKNWSILLEIKIVFKTIKVILTKKGT